VFDVGLLAQVAYSRQTRASGRHPIHAVNRKARSYPLAGITYCAHCEQLAQKHNNPKLRSLLSGKIGKYYRHKPGVKCGTGKTMVTREKYETDFMRLVHLMELNPESFDRLLELSDHLDCTQFDGGWGVRKFRVGEWLQRS
jgi:hypothetical protein